MKEPPILFSGPMVRAILKGDKRQTRRLLSEEDSKFLDFFSGEDPTDPRHAIEYGDFWGGLGWYVRSLDYHDEGSAMLSNRHGAVGDRLWVREAWRYADWTEDGYPYIEKRSDGSVDLCENIPADWASRVTDAWIELSDATKDGERAADKNWRPSIFMPRWASRITLELLTVRIQRLQDITEQDARAEGLSCLSKDGGITWKYGIPDRDGQPGTDDDGQPWSEWHASARVSFSRLWDTINGKRAPWSSNPWVWALEFSKIDQELQK